MGGVMCRNIINDSNIVNDKDKLKDNDEKNENVQCNNSLKNAFKRSAEIFQDMCNDYPS